MACRQDGATPTPLLIRAGSEILFGAEMKKGDHLKLDAEAPLLRRQAAGRALGLNPASASPINFTRAGVAQW